MLPFFAGRHAKLRFAQVALMIGLAHVAAPEHAFGTADASSTPPAWDREHWLFEAAAAAGATDDEAAAGVSRYRNLVVELQRLPLAQQNAAARGQAVLSFLHGRVLTGPFSPSASNVALALIGEAYNCLSASLLYVALAAEVGLDAQVHCTTGHVWCQLRQGSTLLRVETTLRQGIEVLRATGHPSATLQPGDPNALSRQALVGLVHYNRGVQLHRVGQLDAAAAAYRQALAMAPRCRQARYNLLAIACGQWFCRLRNARRLAVEKLSLTASHF